MLLDNLSKPLIIFDLEATGVDPAKDRIVQLSAVKILPEFRPWINWLVNPQIPIPPNAAKVHGITNEKVAEAPPFSDLAERIHLFFAGCDLAGFNLSNFDVPLLWEEFYRCGFDWDLSGVRIVDAGGIFKKKEPRTLAAAVEKFCGHKHEVAHCAYADTLATLKVLEAQVSHYPDLQTMNVAELAEFSRLEELPRIDLAGKLVRDKDGDAVYNFSKVKGLKIEYDLGFGYWMLRSGFSENTKRHLREEIARVEAKAQD